MHGGHGGVHSWVVNKFHQILLYCSPDRMDHASIPLEEMLPGISFRHSTTNIRRSTCAPRCSQCAGFYIGAGSSMKRPANASASSLRSSSKSAARRQPIEFLTHWLEDHAAVTDRMTGAYLRYQERAQTLAPISYPGIQTPDVILGAWAVAHSWFSCVRAQPAPRVFLPAATRPRVTKARQRQSP